MLWDYNGAQTRVSATYRRAEYTITASSSDTLYVPISPIPETPDSPGPFFPAFPFYAEEFRDALRPADLRGGVNKRRLPHGDLGDKRSWNWRLS